MKSLLPLLIVLFGSDERSGVEYFFDCVTSPVLN